MFYGAYVLSKKGPLAKVWLAAHWDKKLTKAHVFETDVSATVEDIISPKVRMALRTSGHLLLGVVRIYSRKQKYLIHDLGEACAKIRMAFRPGIVDLPSEGGVANADAITLPEIFHDFETAVADLGSLGMEEQFTINRSRVAEITIAEDLTSVGPAGNDPISEYGDFGDEFGRGIEEIADMEIRRDRSTYEEKGTFVEKDKTGDPFQLTGDGSSTVLTAVRGDLEMDDKPPDYNDFGGGDILVDLGELGVQEGLGEMQSLADITFEAQAGVQKEGAEEGSAEKGQAAVEVEELMEVDRPPEEQTVPTAANQAAAPDSTLVPTEVEGEFILEPVDITSAVDTSTKGKKRKRKLVVDTDKEFTSEMIRSQLQDYSDTLQQKLFPPPTKRAMLWKDMTTCEQLFQRPVFLFAAPEVLKTVTRNYLSKLRDEPTNESLIDLDPEAAAEGRGVRAVSAEVEKGRCEAEGDKREAVGEDAAVMLNITDAAKDTTLPSEIEHDYGAMEEGGRPNDMDGVPIEGEVIHDEQASRVIPEMPDLEGVMADEVSAQTTGDEKSSAEMSEEFEKQRWTKRTQQVLRILDRGFSSHTDMPFSSLTQKCSRKQAASRFYTCLLLAKENTIHVKQAKAYGEIIITRAPKFTEAF